MTDVSLEVLELLPDGIIVADRSGLIQFVNPPALSMFGYEKDELLNQKIEVLIPSKYRKNHALHRKEYAENPSPRLMSNREELFGIHKDGTNIPVEISLGPISTQSGMLIIAIIRDTRPRKYVEILERKNKELEQFTYVASHDLQEPLRTINGFSEMLNQKYKGGEDKETEKYTRFILEASSRMGILVKSLLDHSLIGRKKELGSIDCNEVLKSTLEDLDASIKESNAYIKIDKLPKIRGYEVEFRVLCQNLIANAIKFKQKDIDPLIEVSAKEEQNQWLFSFKDNGIGINESYKDRVFVIFQRLNRKTDYAGTGIGLAHCKKIVDLHGGRIWVESTLGKGSTFYFTIPF